MFDFFKKKPAHTPRFTRPPIDDAAIERERRNMEQLRTLKYLRVEVNSNPFVGRVKYQFMRSPVDDAWAIESEVVVTDFDVKTGETTAISKNGPIVLYVPKDRDLQWSAFKAYAAALMEHACAESAAQGDK